MRTNVEGPIFRLAEQLVNDPEQMQVYDNAKWNLLGHAFALERLEGQYPWLKREDNRGVERAYTVPVFSGFSTDHHSVIVVRKDPWTHQMDPASWLVAEQNLMTGAYSEPQIISVSVDTAKQLWLQVAPGNISNWPEGRHPQYYAPKYDQLRIQAKLGNDYLTQQIEYVEGLRGDRVLYEDLEVLEMMIIAVQSQRREDARLLLPESGDIVWDVPANEIAA